MEFTITNSRFFDQLLKDRPYVGNFYALQINFLKEPGKRTILKSQRNLGIITQRLLRRCNSQLNEVVYLYKDSKHTSPTELRESYDLMRLNDYVIESIDAHIVSPVGQSYHSSKQSSLEISEDELEWDYFADSYWTFQNNNNQNFEDFLLNSPDLKRTK
jgi:hypothetical protein